MPNTTNIIEFYSTLRERELKWFIKWHAMHQNPTIDEV